MVSERYSVRHVIGTGWHVLDTKTQQYVTYGYDGPTGEVFVGSLAECFNRDNRMVVERFMKGGDHA